MNELKQLIMILEDNANPILSKQMSAYLLNKFVFFGLQKPTRVILFKDFLNKKKQDKNLDWDLINHCFTLPQRELQYLAIDYLVLMQKRIIPDDFAKLKILIKTKSWWESVDTLSPIIGSLVKSYPILLNDMESWITNENIWIKRVSIIFQLKYKKDTNLEFLEKAITSNSTSKEFFINKAIGWALREYSKTDPNYVREFLTKHKLSNLSVREASKKL